jgi:hypothetical protein
LLNINFKKQNKAHKKNGGSTFLGRMILFFGKTIPKFSQCLKSKLCPKQALDSLAKKQLAHEPPVENHESYYDHSLIPVSDLNGCICHHSPGATTDANQIGVAEHGQLTNVWNQKCDLRVFGISKI